ncbi:HK97 family phage prohead protease [Paracoccus sp. (in: a-proteobacteria)]|uniref:HK97 family phage prohead protease n=1 Tax=Paracoccus sp. TaxID=267 RepID=UPI0026DECF69|nr:HK97 family phage prohead protease [Paracoccus sp. (in: a-proteobacteria)]MDO5647980.1 HK97 family phage prohead protease [Paracoccus sp. (in: a-proteobacteria)]
MVPGLEVKFTGGAPVLTDGQVIEGYASLFGLTDQGGDAVAPGAFRASLDRLAAKGDKVRMLWQHDPTRPIGVWDDIREDAKGLWVRGRLLPDVAQAREAAALIAAGAIEGLSIGYRTIRAERDPQGRRKLIEVDLWEVSLVTFPMLPEAKVGRKHTDDLRDITALFTAATQALRGN